MNVDQFLFFIGIGFVGLVVPFVSLKFVEGKWRW